MKTLIVYYSSTLNNEKLARHLHEQLHCDIVRIETVGKRNRLSIFLDLIFNRKPEIKPVPYYLRDYDHIVFVAPIWAGKVAMPLKSFVLNERANISHYSFVTLCGGGNADQKAKIQNELMALTGKVPDKVVELWISRLLPARKDDAMKSISEYKIDAGEFSQFDHEINEVLKILKVSLKST